MKLGLFVDEKTWLSLKKPLLDEASGIGLMRFNAIHDIYYSLFTSSQPFPNALLLQSDLSADALDKLVRCVRENFPDLPVFILNHPENETGISCTESMENNSAGIKALVKKLKALNRQAQTTPSLNHNRQINAPTTDEKRLDSLYQKYELMLNNAGEAIIGINRYGRITFINQFACQLFECSESELLGSHLSDFALDSPLDEGSSHDSFTASGRSRRRIGRGVIRRKNGNLVCVEYTQTYVGNRQDDTVSVMVVEDISQRVKFETKLKTLANCDPLTGLFNRHYLQRAFAKVKNSQRKEPALGAMLYLDLDNFKQINDTHGHNVGDKLLIAFSERLKANCRRDDLIARLGGDEFAILSTLSDQRALSSMAKHLLAELMSPYPIEGLTLNISASIGITVIKQSDDSLETCLARADKAMYKIKKSGKASFSVSAM